jgi:hypothetical protein
MNELFPALAVAFVAFCIWLTVRIVNRRERWAKLTLATAVGLQVLYVVSFGPACWITSQDCVIGKPVTTNRGLIVYFPLARALVNHHGARCSLWLCWWMTVGTPKGRAAIVPTNASGTSTLTVDPDIF